jgi:hypothetical protein
LRFAPEKLGSFCQNRTPSFERHMLRKHALVQPKKNWLRSVKMRAKAYLPASAGRGSQIWL